MRWIASRWYVVLLWCTSAGCFMVANMMASWTHERGNGFVVILTALGLFTVAASFLFVGQSPERPSRKGG